MGILARRWFVGQECPTYVSGSDKASPVPPPTHRSVAYHRRQRYGSDLLLWPGGKKCQLRQKSRLAVEAGKLGGFRQPQGRSTATHLACWFSRLLSPSVRFCLRSLDPDDHRPEVAQLIHRLFPTGCKRPCKTTFSKRRLRAGILWARRLSLHSCWR